MEQNLEYDSLGLCNECGSSSVKILKEWKDDNIIVEAETQCSICGNKDYWAYGYYQSRADGFDKARKYQPNKRFF